MGDSCLLSSYTRARAYTSGALIVRSQNGDRVVSRKCSLGVFTQEVVKGHMVPGRYHTDGKGAR